MFNPGAELPLRRRSSNTVPEENLTPLILDLVAEGEMVSVDELVFDIKVMEISFDAGKIIFSARVVAEPINQNLKLTTWNLWTYNLVTDEMGYVIPTRIRRHEGRVQIYAGLDENRNVPAAALHIYDPNTGTLKQISFN